MTEPQDVIELAERHLDRRNPPPGHAAYREPELPASEWRAAYFVLARIALEQLDECRAALVRTPETLDVERLRKAMLIVDEADPGIFNIVAISDPDTRPVAEALAAEYARLAASPAPDPGAGLLNGGRCAAQAETAHHGWVQCVKQPFHEDRHVWGDDNQVTPAEGFA